MGKLFKSLEEVQLRSTNKPIGYGAFSEVQLVYHSNNPSVLYAMKVLKKKNNLDVNLIKKEIDLHKSLHHENIIKFLDYLEYQNMVYIFLEYAENGDVFEFLIRNKPDSMFLNKLFYQTCLAVKYIHNNNIIHRDIKPENLLMDSKFNIKLCDFGWAGKLSLFENRQTHCGTYEYMPPEVYFRQKQSKKTDIWSLGIFLYELYHSRTPFDIKDSNRFNKESFQIKFKENIDPDVKILISMMLVLNPLNRIGIEDLVLHPFFYEVKKQLLYQSLIKPNDNLKSDQNKNHQFLNKNNNNPKIINTININEQKNIYAQKQMINEKDKNLNKKRTIEKNMESESKRVFDKNKNLKNFELLIETKKQSNISEINDSLLSLNNSDLKPSINLLISDTIEKNGFYEDNTTSQFTYNENLKNSEDIILNKSLEKFIKKYENDNEDIKISQLPLSDSNFKKYLNFQSNLSGSNIYYESYYENNNTSEIKMEKKEESEKNCFMTYKVQKNDNDSQISINTSNFSVNFEIDNVSIKDSPIKCLTKKLNRNRPFSMNKNKLNRKKENKAMSVEKNFINKPAQIYDSSNPVPTKTILTSDLSIDKEFSFNNSILKNSIDIQNIIEKRKNISTKTNLFKNYIKDKIPLQLKEFKSDKEVKTFFVEEKKNKKEKKNFLKLSQLNIENLINKKIKKQYLVEDFEENKIEIEKKNKFIKEEKINTNINLSNKEENKNIDYFPKNNEIQNETRNIGLKSFTQNRSYSQEQSLLKNGKIGQNKTIRISLDKIKGKQAFSNLTRIDSLTQNHNSQNPFQKNNSNNDYYNYYENNEKIDNINISSDKSKNEFPIYNKTNEIEVKTNITKHQVIDKTRNNLVKNYEECSRLQNNKIPTKNINQENKKLESNTVSLKKVVNGTPFRFIDINSKKNNERFKNKIDDKSNYQKSNIGNLVKKGAKIQYFDMSKYHKENKQNEFQNLNHDLLSP